MTNLIKLKDALKRTYKTVPNMNDQSRKGCRINLPNCLLKKKVRLVLVR